MALQWQFCIPQATLKTIVASITLGQLGNHNYAVAARQLLDIIKNPVHVYDSQVEVDEDNVYIPTSLSFIATYIRGTLMHSTHSTEHGMTSQFFLLLAEQRNLDELTAADKLLGYEAAGTLKLRGRTGHTHRMYAIHPRQDGRPSRVYISDASGRHDVYPSFQAALAIHEPVRAS